MLAGLARPYTRLFIQPRKTDRQETYAKQSKELKGDRFPDNQQKHSLKFPKKQRVESRIGMALSIRSSVGKSLCADRLPDNHQKTFSEAPKKTARRK
ncbi:MAG: hypothetical protein QNJ74_23725 [Trichodesmium sp. MO_231.B1]|nr:hypothetical protein [Trichodesmium sp. MO_231.B1]